MYPQAYIDYLIYFHTNRDYFECHEVLEEYWKKEKKQSNIWVGLIQLAVALYHYRRKNYSGAYKLIKRSQQILAKEPLEKFGLNKERLLEQLKQYEQAIQEKKDFRDLNLPIIEKTLLKKCQAICNQKGLIWGKATNFSNEYIIHKHSLRDRTDVIETRHKEWLARKKERNQ